MTKTTTTTGKTEVKAKRTAKRTPKPKAGSDGSKHWAYAGVALMAVMRTWKSRCTPTSTVVRLDTFPKSRLTATAAIPNGVNS